MECECNDIAAKIEEEKCEEMRAESAEEEEEEEEEEHAEENGEFEMAVETAPWRQQRYNNQFSQQLFAKSVGAWQLTHFIKHI